MRILVITMRMSIHIFMPALHGRSIGRKKIYFLRMERNCLIKVIRQIVEKNMIREHLMR